MKNLFSIALLFLIAFTVGSHAQMVMHYSTYTSKSLSPQNRITTTVTVQGNTTWDPSCTYCQYATHMPTVLNQIVRRDTGAIIAGGTTYGPRVTPPSTQINYTSYVTFDPFNPSSGPGPWRFIAQSDVDCSFAGRVWEVVPPPVDIEIAITLMKMRPTQVPPGGTCNNGVEDCDYDAFTWCTPSTTPPDYAPLGVVGVSKATYPTYWTVYALCERLGPGFAWLCTPGITGNGLSGPDNYPKLACTKTP